MGKKLFLFCFLLICNVFYGQDLFSIVEIGKNDTINKTPYNSSVSWKHLYNDTKWSRLGGNFNLNFNYKKWTLKAGNNLQYTFDEQIINNFEVRPWIGLKLNSDIFSDLNFNQEARLEWRNFFYQGTSNENYIRTTFDVYAVYNPKSLGLNDWLVELGYVWYFLKEPAYGERYADSREFRFLVTKAISVYKVTFGYKHEKFKRLVDRPFSNAHSLQASFLF